MIENFIKVHEPVFRQVLLNEILMLKERPMEIRKKIRKNLFLFAIILILPLWPGTSCLAASATINLSTAAEEVTVGDDITVSLSIASDAMLGDFEAYITYNADILEFKSDASFIAGGEGLLKLTDKNTVNQETSRKYIMKFTAKAIGVSEIAIRDKAEVYELESGLAMSVSDNSIDIKVSAAKTASDNTNLKSLKVSPGKLSPGFDKNKMEYTVDLKYEEDKLVLSGVPEDENAKVTIEGNENLKEGKNKVSVKVKAESGDIKEYTITAIRHEKDNEQTDELNDTNETETDKDSGQEEYNNIAGKSAEIGKLSVIKDGEDLYIQNGYRYRILEPGEDTSIPEGYTKTSLILNDIPVTAYTPSNNLDSDFLLLYAMNEDGDTGFYQYDRREETLQRYVKGREGNKVVMSGDLLQSEEYKAKLTTMVIVLAVLGSVCIILSVALIRMYLKHKEDKDEIR